MAWKIVDGVLALDNGNPVWVFDSGEEKGIDYAEALKRQSETNVESRKRKEEIRA